MAMISTSSRADRNAVAGEPRRRVRLVDRLLDGLEAWIEMRTRRNQARVDTAIERATKPPVRVVHAPTDWWRSWRASTRRRGCTR